MGHRASCFFGQLGLRCVSTVMSAWEGIRCHDKCPRWDAPSWGVGWTGEGAAMGVSRLRCLCLLSGARSAWLGHACHSPTVKPSLCYRCIPGLTQRTARSAWNPCGSSVPDVGSAVGTFLSTSHVPLWLEHPAPPALTIFFQEFIACLGFRKHLHRARLGSQGSDFRPLLLAGQVPPSYFRCLPVWHSGGQYWVWGFGQAFALKV